MDVPAAVVPSSRRCTYSPSDIQRVAAVNAAGYVACSQRSRGAR